MRSWITSTLGYPRIGERLEWNHALEAFWAGRMDEYTFMQRMKAIRFAHLTKQNRLGIEWIASNDFSLYDHMLDMTAMFGLVPERFGYTEGAVDASTYFAMALGTPDAEACDMKRWFQTDYFYVVPELGSRLPKLTENRILAAFLEAKESLGLITKPVLIGPYTYVKLSKGISEKDTASWIHRLIPLYRQILRELASAGAEWIQIDEPCMAAEATNEEMAFLQEVYEQLHEAAPQLRIMLQVSFGAANCYEKLIRFPVQGIGLDFVHGKEQNFAGLTAHGFPSDKRLGVGLIDGQNIWRTDLLQAASLARDIASHTSGCELVLQPSCSLLHVPVTLADESELFPLMKDSLSFADEKLSELRTLAAALNRTGTAALAALEKMRESASAVKQAKLAPAPVHTESSWIQSRGTECVKPHLWLSNKKGRVS